jgi:hypothetical protein
VVSALWNEALRELALRSVITLPRVVSTYAWELCRSTRLLRGSWSSATSSAWLTRKRIRVERVMIADGQVALELRPVGLAVPDTVRVRLPADAVTDRLERQGSEPALAGIPPVLSTGG